MMPLWLKRDYRAVSMALASCILGTLFMRIMINFTAFSDTYGGYIGQNALFSVISQGVFFFGIPFIVYRFYGKRNVKEIARFSSAGKFKPYFLLALPLGAAVYVLTIGVSAAWMGLLRATGYNYSSYTPDMPARFSFGLFLAEVLITAVLPGICEEFAMRGGLLTTAKKSFGTLGCVIICGVIFGLFHQSIRQVFYTSLFGALAAFIVIKTKSIYPAVIMHFTNNFCSVFFDYADNYDWAIGGGFYDFINGCEVWELALVFAVAALAVAALVILMLYLRERKVIEKKKDVLKDAAFEVTQKKVVLMGEFDPERVRELEMEKEVYGSDYAEERHKPKARDIMFIVSIGVVALCTTVFSYVWGFFY